MLDYLRMKSAQNEDATTAVQIDISYRIHKPSHVRYSFDAPLTIVS